MEEQMKIIISATDNASSTFQSVENAVDDLGDSLGLVGDEGTQEMDQLGDGADQAEDDVRKLGDEADKTADEVEDLGNKSESSGATMQMAFQNIADGVMRAKEGVVELGRNLMETLNLAGQQQQQETFLKMNIGAEGAAKQMKIINDLVADLPGDDVAIGGLLSQAAAKNAGITADELKRMGVNAADYFAAMSNYGKSSAEAQQDLTNYILTGNTAELERSPILQGHIDKLKEATTVEERNKALQEAMNEEGWSGISQQDTYNNKLETFTAMLDRGKRKMGEMFIDAAGGAMDFIGKLDDATGGVLGIGIAAGSVTAGPLIDMFTGVGQVATGVKALRDAYKDLAITEGIVNLVEGEGAIARVANALGITSEAAAAEGATIAFGGLAIAEDAALWPILLIIGAIIALGIAIYEVGKYFGWWTDFGTMLDAIKAGVQRLWSAFISHPDVQGFISAMIPVWNWLQYTIASVIKWVQSFFQNNSGEKFDFVRALIDAVGVAWKAMTTPIRLVITVVKLVLKAIQKWYLTTLARVNMVKELFRRLPNQIRGAISGLLGIITKPFKDAYEKIKGTVDSIKTKAKSITNISLSSLTDKIFGPVRDAYNKIKDKVDKIKAKLKEIPVVGGAFGFDYEGMLEELNKQSGTANVYTSSETSLSLDHNINFRFDFTNLPEGTSEENLIAMLQSAITDRSVISSLVNSPDFQSLDGKVKERLVLKGNRARGV